MRFKHPKLNTLVRCKICLHDKKWNTKSFYATDICMKCYLERDIGFALCHGKISWLIRLLRERNRLDKTISDRILSYKKIIVCVQIFLIIIQLISYFLFHNMIFGNICMLAIISLMFLNFSVRYIVKK
jgi:hypothetical protein